MNLRGVDLNLLPVLLALLQERGVTAASKRLAMSQPAVSHALGRLRAVLKDPLLVTIGRTTRLTAQAEQLLPDLERICRDVETLLAGQAFDPAASTRQFVVAAPDYIALMLGPYLLDRLCREAPGVRVRLVSDGFDLVADIASARIDLAIVARTGALGPGLVVESQFADSVVGVVAADHPLARTPPSDLADLEAWPWIGAEVWRTLFTPADPLWPLIERAPQQSVLSLSYLLLLPMIAAQSRGVTFVPQALADHVGALTPLAQFALPGLVSELELCQVWSPLLDTDPAHRWLRALTHAAMGRHFRPLHASGAGGQSADNAGL